MNHEEPTSLVNADHWQSELARLAKLLTRSTRSAPLIAIVAVEDQLVEQEIADRLRVELGIHLRAIEFDVERRDCSLKAFLHSVGPHVTDAVFVRGLWRLPKAPRQAAMQSLNRERDVLRQFHCAIVVFLLRDMVPEFVRWAGDFWDCKSGFIEFPEPRRAHKRARMLEQRREYLHQVTERYSSVEMSGVLQGDAGAVADLEAVFVEPYVSVGQSSPAMDDAETAVPYTSLLQVGQCSVLLGAPGAGKTMLLKHIALTLTEAPASRDHKLRLSGTNTDFLPVVLPLPSFASRLDQQPSLLLSDYFPFYFFEQKFGGLDELRDMFQQELVEGNCVVMLDGLDEIPSANQRIDVIQRIDDLMRQFPFNTCVIASRTVAYDQAPLRDACQCLTILPLGIRQVSDLVTRWCKFRHDNPEKAHQASDTLLGAIEHERDLASLAENPLLLTILIHLYLDGRFLPERRGELFRVATAAMAENWAMQRSISGQPLPMQLDGEHLSERRIVEVLGPVAFWLQKSRPSGQLSRDELARHMRSHFVKQESLMPQVAQRVSEEFITLIQERSGLLVELRTGQYGFVHHSFQEYLAARYLSTRPDVFAQALALIPDHNWEEVLVLLGATLQDKHLRSYLQFLLDAQIPPQVAGENILIAGRCLQSAEPQLSRTPLGLEIIRALVSMAENPSMPFERRREAGSVLGLLGDPRADQMIEIPEGAFSMGIRDEELSSAAIRTFVRDLLERSTPSRTIHLPTYYIDRHPVTHAQYERFMQDGGYQRRELWSPAGQEWLEMEKRSRPWYWDSYQWNRPNYPVIAVSWYEAEAYANWAGKRLPTEAEWEKAARGTDGRRWPWGDEWDDGASNAEAGLGQLTPIGIHPRGVSPFGVWDMSGNVWEWTVDWFAPYAQHDQAELPVKVLRGGAWNQTRDHARCAARVVSPPDARPGSAGFRCVADAPPNQLKNM